MFRKKDVPVQQRLWIPTSEIVSTPANAFLTRLDQVLEAHDFPRQVRQFCRPYYAEPEEGGRPGIDPVVYFKMLLIAYYENLSSERAIAARCADSLSIRRFLHYDLREATPDHSSLSVIRSRLRPEVFQQVFALVLSALKQHKLVRGKKLGLDASTMEANASMRTLQRRLTGESYQSYVKKLAREAGLDADDKAALQQADIKTVVADPIENRNLQKLSKHQRKAVYAARRSAKAKYGKALTRRRGMYVERSFEHVLDCGGARKTTLRGQQKIQKRYLIQAMGCKLSLLMRKLFGIGTVKQALAAAVALCLMILPIMTLIVTQALVSMKFVTKRVMAVGEKFFRALTSVLGRSPHQLLHAMVHAG